MDRGSFWVLVFILKTAFVLVSMVHVNTKEVLSSLLFSRKLYEMYFKTGATKAYLPFKSEFPSKLFGFFESYEILERQTKSPKFF